MAHRASRAGRFHSELARHAANPARMRRFVNIKNRLREKTGKRN
jgi:hypothetical protein